MRKILILTSMLLIYSQAIYAGLNVLLTAPEVEGTQTDMVSGLSAFSSDFDSVVWWNMQTSGQPTLSDIEAYDCVVTWSDYQFPYAVVWGNTLADYVDGGGKVILCPFCWSLYENYYIEGRIITDGYSPLLGHAGDWYTQDYWELTNPDKPSNPCLDSVTSLSCGWQDIVDLASWGHLITHYQDDYEEAIAYNIYHSVAGINANPCQLNIDGYEECDWTGDYPQAMRNTIVWLCSYTKIQPTSLGELKARFK